MFANLYICHTLGSSIYSSAVIARLWVSIGYIAYHDLQNCSVLSHSEILSNAGSFTVVPSVGYFC